MPKAPEGNSGFLRLQQQDYTESIAQTLVLLYHRHGVSLPFAGA